MNSLHVCRSCLAYNVKLFYMDENYLKTYYEPIIGKKIIGGHTMFPLCFECKALVRKTTKFRDRSKMVAHLFQKLMEHDILITESSIDTLRCQHNLYSQLSINTDSTPMIYVNEDEPVIKLEVTGDYNYMKDESVSLPYNEDPKNETVSYETDPVVLRSLESGQFNFDPNIDHIFCDDSISNNDETLSELNENETLRKLEDVDEVFIKRLKKKKHKRKLEKSKFQKNKVKIVKKAKEKSLRRTFFFKPDYVTEIFLTREQQIAEIKEKAASCNYTGSPMRCDRCFKGFLKEDAFKNHMSKHAESAGAYECDLCGFRYKNKIRLTTHVNGHIRRFSCKRCDYISQTPAKARSHENWHKGVTYECHVCQKRFNRETTRSNHVRKEHPTVFCHICGNSFVGENGLDLHRKLAHARTDDSCQKSGGDSLGVDTALNDSSRDNYCVTCDIPFTSAIALTNHIVKSNKHAHDTIFVCKICTNTFPSRRLLSRHVREHMNEECLTTDNKQDGRPAESDEKRWRCNNCAAVFSSAVSFDNHKKKMRQGECNVKDFVCEWCGKRFQAKAVLQCHIRIHTGEKPFECTKCPKRFNTRAILLRHLRMHTGERPFSCDICGTRFKEKSALARHSMVHSGVKPHYCVLCSKAYTCKWWLKQHLNSAHGKAHSTIQ